MTRQTFYRNLRKVAGRFKWKCSFGEIRCVKNKKLFCPITAVAEATTGERFSISEFKEAGHELGLSREDILVIVEAADNDCVDNPECRKTLIRSVGLD